MMRDLISAIENYAYDTENDEKNYFLATIYDKYGQTAAAVSYYLRCAERTKNDNLAYECLLHVGRCFDSQDNRHTTVRSLYKHAIAFLPKRPEAYYFLAKFDNNYANHVDAYTFCNLALSNADIANTEPLRNSMGYPGIAGILYERSVAGWHWGKTEETKQTLLDLKFNHTLTDDLKYGIEITLKNINVDASAFVKVTENLDKMDIVLQGSFGEDTLEIIKEYLNLPFVNKIIVSGWADDPKADLIKPSNRVRVVLSAKPITPGTDNRNLQIVSSDAGLKQVTTNYAAKMRTDQLYDTDSMMNMYKFFKENGTDKIYVAGVYPNLLFHPRDHIFWGETSKLRQLFDAPIEINGFIDRIKVDKNNLAKYYGFFIRTETYLGAHYASKYDERINFLLLEPEKYLHDGASRWNDAYEVSKNVVPKLFKSFPRQGINLTWSRKNLATYPYDEQKTFYNECWHEDGV